MWLVQIQMQLHISNSCLFIVCIYFLIFSSLWELVAATFSVNWVNYRSYAIACKPHMTNKPYLKNQMWQIKTIYVCLLFIIFNLLQFIIAHRVCFIGIRIKLILSGESPLVRLMSGIFFRLLMLGIKYH